MKNPFTAPDIADVMREKQVSLRNVVVLLFSGVVLVAALLGGYRLGTWLLVHVAPEEAAMPAEEVESEESVLDARLRELGGGDAATPDPLEVQKRVEELGGSATAEQAAPPDESVLKNRLEELGG